jgi:response regulator RpfG family c-di-GMP phosphodiesterase
MITESAMTILGSLADAADARSGMPGHCKRVATLTAYTLKALGITGKDAQQILDAARLHDIGKLGVPEVVLSRLRPLTPVEWKWIHRHTDRGAAYLRGQPGTRPAAEIVLHHHERIDGDGYPGRMRGTSIPLGSRIIAIAECFDALTHGSPFRAALPVSTAISALMAGAGRQWDGSILETFLESTVPELLEGRSRIL